LFQFKKKFLFGFFLPFLTSIVPSSSPHPNLPRSLLMPSSYADETHNDGSALLLPFAPSCGGEMCGPVVAQLQEQRAAAERLKIENEVLRLSLSDQGTTKDSTAKELRRLLDKETGLVNALNAELAPDPNGQYPCCAWCMHHRAQARSVRDANAQEYRWVAHFAKLSQSLRLELEDALLKEKARHLQLRCAHEELHQRKTDPLGRDAEVARLRGEAAEARRQQSHANQTAVMANKVAEALRRELMQAQERVEELEARAREGAGWMQALEEAVDACRRSEELKGCAVGECRDYVCRRRAMDLVARERELREQIEELRRERVQHLGAIARLRQDSEAWQTVLDGEGLGGMVPPAIRRREEEEEKGGRRKEDGGDEEEEEDNRPQSKRHQPQRHRAGNTHNNSAKRPPPPPAPSSAPAISSKTPLVAELDRFMDLTIHLRSLFQIFPAWQNEDLDEEEMLRDFMADIDPSERALNLRWLLEACRVAPEEDASSWETLAASKLARRCFAACIRALGGIARKAGASRVVWTNVRRTRRPVFAKKAGGDDYHPQGAGRAADPSTPPSDLMKCQQPVVSGVRRRLGGGEGGDELRRGRMSSDAKSCLRDLRTKRLGDCMLVGFRNRRVGSSIVNLKSHFIYTKSTRLLSIVFFLLIYI
jgi:hypothetical protein